MKKTFEDGTTFGPAEFAVALFAGAVIALPIILLQNKMVKIGTRRAMKKYGWPQAAVDAI